MRLTAPRQGTLSRRPPRGLLHLIAGLALTLAALLPPGGNLRAAEALTWQALPPLPDPIGFAAPFAGVTEGALLVAGGANFPDGRPWTGARKIWHDRIFVLDRPDGAWRVAEAKLPRPLGYGVSLTTPQGVACLGGSDETRHYADAFLLRKVGDRIERHPLPPLPQPVANFCGAVLGSTIYVAGGLASPAATATLRTFWALDLAASQPQWRELEPWPGRPRMLAVAAVQDGSFFLFSGTDLVPDASGGAAREYLRDAWRFTPGAGWQRLPDLPRPAVAAPTPAFAVGQSHVLVVGGDDGAHAARVAELRDAHPGFPADVLAYHTITDTWTRLGRFPAAPGPDPAGNPNAGDWPAVTAPTVKWGDRHVVPSGEVRPGVRTPKVWAAQAIAARTVFGWANYTTLSLYLLAMVGIGVVCSRRIKDTNDFFRGGQSIPWWAAGISIFATMLSSITFMAIPAAAYSGGWRLALNNTYIVLMPLIVFVFLPFYRQLNVTSAYEYLEKRFNVATRLVASGLFILFQVGRIAIVLFLPSLALATVANFSITACILIMGVLCIIYTVMGGMEAVVWTDVAQTAVLMGGAVFSLILIVGRVDGTPGELVATVVDGGKFLASVDWSWNLVSGTAWTIMLGSIFHNLFAYAASQDVVQRYFTTKDEATAARAIWTNALLAVPAQLLFFAIGSALYVYYRQQPSRLEPAFQTDAIFPLFIVREMPVGIAGLIIAAIFAAAQSTLSSSLNSVSAACVTDFYRRFRPGASEAAALRLARIITVVAGVLGVGTALWVAQADLRSLFEAFLGVIGLFGGTISGLFLLGVFTTRTSGAGAVIGALVSAGTVLAVRSHVHFYAYAATGIVSCVVVGYAASWLLPRDRRDLTGLTLHTRSSAALATGARPVRS